MKHGKQTSGGGFNPVSAPDYLPLAQLRQLQLDRLKSIVKRAYDNVLFHRQRMEEKGVTPGDIQSLEDITRLHFAMKDDLREAYPFGLFASPMEEVVRVHASSGTTGKPTVAAYTQEDINVWTNVMVRSFISCGCHRGDIIQNAYGYGLFTGGLGAHYGAEALGATVIPISGGNTDRQIMIMKDFGSNAISCTPSYFVHLAERALEMGIDLRELPLRVGVFGAEPWSDGLRQRAEEIGGIKAYDIYGLSEIIGPGVAIECAMQQGLHIFEDHFYPEIIDPETCEPVAPGEEGELVLTTLSKVAMPLLRYRTRDITRMIPQTCECGRTICRMARIGRRSDDMFIIRGVNVYPSQIEAALLKVEGTSPHYQIVLSRDKDLDQMEVQFEVTPEMFGDTVGSVENLQRTLCQAIESTIGVRAKITLVEPHSIERSQGKAKRVIDKRGG